MFLFTDILYPKVLSWSDVFLRSIYEVFAIPGVKNNSIFDATENEYKWNADAICWWMLIPPFLPFKLAELFFVLLANVADKLTMVGFSQEEKKPELSPVRIMIRSACYIALHLLLNVVRCVTSPITQLFNIYRALHWFDNANGTTATMGRNMLYALGGVALTFVVLSIVSSGLALLGVFPAVGMASLALSISSALVAHGLASALAGVIAFAATMAISMLVASVVFSWATPEFREVINPSCVGTDSDHQEMFSIFGEAYNFTAGQYEFDHEGISLTMSLNKFDKEAGFVMGDQNAECMPRDAEDFTPQEAAERSLFHIYRAPDVDSDEKARKAAATDSAINGYTPIDATNPMYI